MISPIFLAQLRRFPSFCPNNFQHPIPALYSQFTVVEVSLPLEFRICGYRVEEETFRTFIDLSRILSKFPCHEKGLRWIVWSQHVETFPAEAAGNVFARCLPCRVYVSSDRSALLRNGLSRKTWKKKGILYGKVEHPINVEDTLARSFARGSSSIFLS